MNNPHSPTKLDNQPDASLEMYHICSSSTQCWYIREKRRGELKLYLEQHLKNNFPNILK